MSDAAEFQSALAQVENSAQSDEIRLRVGTYHTADNGSLGNGFALQNSQPAPVKISGGWLGAGCLPRDGRLPADATVLHGGDSDIVLTITAGFSGLQVTIENLTISHGYAHEAPGLGGGLLMLGSNNHTFHHVLIDGVMFQNNNAENASALLLGDAETVHVRNSVFFDNDASDNGTAILNALTAVYFTNNTVIQNTVQGTQDTASVIFSSGSAVLNVVANNIFAEEVVWDVGFFGGNIKNHLLFNVISQFFGPLDSNLGNLDIDPMLNQDLSPQMNSPVVDSGFMPSTHPNQPPEGNWLLGQLDLLRTPRLSGHGVDRGAIEFLDEIFDHGFEE
ncbi:hypothetical protein [Marinicella meishanensis]|uniref:hypothetical protein n=1 Tax=Marinicella meishanensis TaxID=2873263 RepID=UPI001CBF9854|nr:hypothetical protein [Marinicella sp. NBU2979]